MALIAEIIEKSSGPVYRLPPRWLKIPAAVTYASISRAQLYNLMNAGKINFARVKGRGNGARKARLVDRLSLDAFLESCGK
jgi:hypothetical protein